MFWVYAIELESKATRKAKILDALKYCENEPDIILAVSRLFWKGIISYSIFVIF